MLCYISNFLINWGIDMPLGTKQCRKRNVNTENAQLCPMGNSSLVLVRDI